MMKAIPRYGSGGSRADEWAVKVSKTFAEIVKAEEKGHWFKLIPGPVLLGEHDPLGQRPWGDAERPARARADLARCEP